MLLVTSSAVLFSNLKKIVFVPTWKGHRSSYYKYSTPPCFREERETMMFFIIFCVMECSIFFTNTFECLAIYQHIIFWLLKFSVTVCHQPRKKICMYFMMYLYIVYKHFRPLWEISKVSSSLDIIFDLHFWMVLIKPFSSLCGGNLQKLKMLGLARVLSTFIRNKIRAFVAPIILHIGVLGMEKS